jgi:hypothetical protein
MESSGRNGDDAERPAGDGPEQVRLPLERSPEGRFVIRSSSHPPTDQTSGVDVSGVHSRPQAEGTAPAQREREGEKGRPGRSTPAERPRKRKELKQGGTYRADVRARCDTPRALPGTRISDRPKPMERPVAAAPAVAAFTGASASGGTADEVRSSVDEVTRRVRRPSPIPAPQAAVVDPQSSWRGLLIAGAIVALFLIGIWLFG